MPRNKCNKWPSKFFAKVFLQNVGSNKTPLIRSTYFIGYFNQHTFIDLSQYLSYASGIGPMKFPSFHNLRHATLSWKGEIG